MKIDNEFQLNASREEVWQALNNLDVLKDCIPGCEELMALAEDHFQAAIRAKVGPVNAKFNTEIRLENVNAPKSYSLVVNSKGGAAGMGEGIAHVELIDEEAGSTLRYTVDFKVKGKLAQIGSRLILNVIQKMSNEFFSKFATHFPETGGVEQPAEVATGNELNLATPLMLMGSALVILLILYMLMS